CAWREPALRVVRAKASACEAEVRVRSVGRSSRAREKADELRIFWIFHVHHIRRVVILATVGFERFVHRDDFVLKPGMGGVRDDWIARVERNGAERVEFILQVAMGLGFFYVGEVNDENPERPKAAVTDSAAVF